MDRKNYFELLKIPFDPPESPQVIKKRLSDWKREKEEQKNNTGDQSEINKLLALYDDMEQVLLTPALRQKEAAELKAERLGQLQRMMQILMSGVKSGTTPEVTPAQLRQVGIHLGLAPETVKQVYTDNGYRVRTPSAGININDYFLQPMIFRGIQDYIERLRNTDTPKYPWTKEVTSLFDLLCFFDGNSSSECAVYRRKLTDELCDIARRYSIEIATDTSELGHILGQLFSKATTQVFNSEVNRRKYENSLKKLQQQPFFDLLQTAPDVFKKDPYFAEACIDRIRMLFPDRQLALALYNSETKSIHDPYEPPSADIYVTCPSCQTTAHFHTREEAESARCAVCDMPLYTTCPDPKCRRKIPAAAGSCSCGFSMTEYRLYASYCRLAKQALRNMDLVQAEYYLQKARTANPFDNGLAELGKRIETERRQYDQPIRELQNLMDTGCYAAAGRKLDQILRMNEKLNLSAQRTMIESKLREAERMMPAPTADKQLQANQCVSVLHIVQDYQPAIELLRTLPPQEPTGLRVNLKTNLIRSVAALSWQPAGDVGVTYTVVRKEGGIPDGRNDGTELVSDLTDLHYEDGTIQSGMLYGYAVFACRYTAVSAPASCTLETIMDLDKRFLSFDAKNGNCSFRWTLPYNSIGVRILRTKSGTPSAVPDDKSRVVCEKAQKGYDDTGLNHNTPYTYRLQCIYKIGGLTRYSTGILTDPIIPEEPPCVLQNIQADFKDKIVTVTWDEAQRKTDCIYIRKVREGFDRSLIGTVMPSAELQPLLDTKVLASAYSSHRRCHFPIRYGETVRAAVVSESGSNSVISDVIQIAGVFPCELDREQTVAEGNNLKAVMKHVADDLVRIHYILNERGDSPVWGTVEDVESGASCWISRDEYIRNGNRLIIPHIPEQELCFTVIGEYRMQDGTAVLSAPSNMKINNKPKTEIRYRIRWNKGIFGIRKAEEPYIEIECKEKSLPELYLTCLESGGLPWSMKDDDLRILYTFPEMTIEGESAILPLKDCESRMPEKGTVLRLMLAEEDMQEYYMVPVDINSLKVP